MGGVCAGALQFDHVVCPTDGFSSHHNRSTFLDSRPVRNHMEPCTLQAARKRGLSCTLSPKGCSLEWKPWDPTVCLLHPKCFYGSLKDPFVLQASPARLLLLFSKRGNTRCHMSSREHGCHSGQLWKMSRRMACSTWDELPGLSIFLLHSEGRKRKRV